VSTIEFFIVLYTATDDAYGREDGWEFIFNPYDYVRMGLSRIPRVLNGILTKGRRFDGCTFNILANRLWVTLSDMMVQLDFLVNY
jgi:hypothetical protein